MSANESKLAASRSPLRIKKDNHILTIIALMLLVCIIMLILKPGSYFTVLNVRSMIFQFPEYGVLALGMMACMISCGIDLSLVGIMNLSGVLAALIVKNMVLIEGGEVANPAMVVPAIVLACLVAVAVGVACGAFNGFIIGYFGLPAMLVTLCGLQLYTGLAYGITGSGGHTLCTVHFHRCGGSCGVHYEMHCFRPRDLFPRLQSPSGYVLGH